MEKQTPRSKPITADEFQPWWLHAVRAAVIKDKHELRGGFPLSIEVKGPLAWQPLNLPSNGFEFTTAKDRDKVLGWLTGTIELPPIPEPTPEP